MSNTPIRNLIIGAGPGGLAIAGRLRKMGIDFEIIEQSDKIANAWQNHYDRLCLHTVKQLSHLPHREFPEEFPLYIPRASLVEYYESYARDFKINPHFGEMVISMNRIENDWEVKTDSGKKIRATNVIVATGKNRIENIPEWSHQNQFKGQIIHSRKYRNPKPFLNKKVLIVGMGNTGAELALDLAEHGVEIFISVRGPVSIVPRDVMGNPVQLTARKMAKLPFGLGDWLGTQIRSRIIGDLSRFGLKTDNTPPAALLRDTGKTSVIDIGTVALIKAGKIKILPEIDHFFETGISFKNGHKESFDTVILATGYHAQVEDFIEDVTGFLDKNNNPKQPIGEGKQKGLFFVGFDNYKLGGILGTIYDDSKTVAEEIKKQFIGLK